MNLSIILDWKFAVALGSTAVGIIFAIKMDSPAVERVSTQIVDTCKELVIANNCNC